MDNDLKKNRPWVMPVQAINEDYQDTGFDRGHLNPNFMHCGMARVATFSLTNSVPQDPCFNRIVWYDIESTTKERFEQSCSFKQANRYVITGAVPSKDKFIPPDDIIVDDQPDKQTRRVNVPAYMWTLTCCDSSSANNGTSHFHGIIAENRGEGSIEEFSNVYSMEIRLTELYGSSSNLTLLADGCN
ncbi:hypothetical protein EB796_004818 [Bugula neritina]|uniref:EXOG n=1 Tax=Bugula neritina TaxID=10212 RepID=A0A7J7KG55_BUGNE|nr:hypothetical protein EB796_004818 [Bugula neritina]